MAKETKSESTKGYMSLLRNLDQNQLLELLSQGFCQHCEALLEDRANRFFQTEKVCDFDFNNSDCQDSLWSSEESDRTDQKKIRSQDSVPTPEPIKGSSSLPALSNNKRNSHQHSVPKELIIDDDDGTERDPSLFECGVSEEQEIFRASQMVWKYDFCRFERIDGRLTNILAGLELYPKVFDAEEQKKIVRFVDKLQHKGKKQQLRGRTYSEPRKWMPGKGRVTIQFGCCYNYATDKYGNPPGIVRDAEVEPLPRLFKEMIERMVRWRVLPPTCVPDSCIVNIYNEGDCIPPHIDHHDFAAPFCTVSLLSGCDILFGTNLRIVGAGEFDGPTSIYLPIGISITFRKMDKRKRPYNFQPDPEMQMIKPLVCPPLQFQLDVSHKWPQREAQRDHRYKLNKQSKIATKKRAVHDDKDGIHRGRQVRFRG